MGYTALHFNSLESDYVDESFWFLYLWRHAVSQLYHLYASVMFELAICHAQGLFHIYV